MKLTEKHIISKGHIYYDKLDRLCFLSKNLYNATLYAIRQHYFNTKKYLSYGNVNKQFVLEDNHDYRQLPAATSQQVQRQVDAMFRSFFRAIKSPKMKGKTVHIPGYKDKIDGRYVVTYTGQQVSLKDGVVKFKDKEKNLYSFNTKCDNISEVKIVPKSDYISVNIIYNIPDVVPVQDNGRYASIDLGIDNLVTVTSTCSNAEIIDGRRLKSINQFYNKKVAALQSKLVQDKHTSKRIRQITRRRNFKVEDYLNKASSYVVNQAVSNNICTLIVGYNKGWKQDTNMGKKNNQKFVDIPYLKLLHMLEYKCKMHGIKFVTIEESYTSKCSYYDNEDLCFHTIYAGMRKKRGLFVTSKGVKINADVNGALNIMRKRNNDAGIEDQPVDKRLVLNPVRIEIF